MTPEQRAEALALIEQGVSAGEVARRTGISRNTASRMRQAAQSDAPPAQPAAQSDGQTARPAQPPDTWHVVHGLTEREATALGAYLAMKGETIEGWLAGLAGKVARDVLGLADRAQAAQVASGPERHPLHAPRCPRCSGAVLIDQTGRRCLNRGCAWKGSA